MATAKIVLATDTMTEWETKINDNGYLQDAIAAKLGA